MNNFTCEKKELIKKSLEEKKKSFEKFENIFEEKSKYRFNKKINFNSKSEKISNFSNSMEKIPKYIPSQPTELKQGKNRKIMTEFQDESLNNNSKISGNGLAVKENNVIKEIQQKNFTELKKKFVNDAKYFIPTKKEETNFFKDIEAIFENSGFGNLNQMNNNETLDADDFFKELNKKNQSFNNKDLNFTQVLEEEQSKEKSGNKTEKNDNLNNFAIFKENLRKRNGFNSCEKSSEILQSNESLISNANEKNNSNNYKIFKLNENLTKIKKILAVLHKEIIMNKENGYINFLLLLNSNYL